MKKYHLSKKYQVSIDSDVKISNCHLKKKFADCQKRYGQYFPTKMGPSVDEKRKKYINLNIEKRKKN